MYRAGAVSGRTSGSIIHWIIRLIIYIATAYLIRGGIWQYNFIISVSNWVWWALLKTGVLIVIAIMIIKLIQRKGAYTNGK